MTGIERLREIGNDYAEHSWSAAGRGRGMLMLEIADQIERERACDADTIESVRLIVGGVIDDMELHCLGHEGMEDSPVARWARELREALCGDGRDRAADVSMSAYDLLPQEDREAIAWVRERGGLERVKAQRRESMPRAAYERKKAGFLGHIAECETALGRRNARIEELRCRVDDLTRENAELRKRHEEVLAADGEPLEVGQTVYGTRDLEPVEIVSLRSKEYDGVRTVKCKDRAGFVFYAPDDLIHQRPVLDADGVPIKKGDTVWEAGTVPAIPMTVVEVSRDTVRCEYTWKDGKTYRPCCSPDTLTHTKPEIDTWERVEEDALNFVEDNAGIPHTQDQMERDMLAILRRCKAIAERERGE